VIPDWVAVFPVAGVFTRVMLEPVRVLRRVSVLAFVPVVERPAFTRQFMAGVFGVVVDVHHELARDFVSFLGAVFDTELDVELREAHDSEANLPVVRDGFFDFVNREIGHRDDVL